ncbi:MAG: sensor histidine kinase [Bacteroidota bacterium]
MTKTLLRNALCVCLLFGIARGYAQPSNDSLKSVIRKAESDTSVINAQLALAKNIIDSQLDSTLRLSAIAYNRSKKIGYTRGIMTASNMLGNYYQRISDFDKAMAFYNESRRIAKKTNDLQGLAGVSNNIGIIYVNKGQFPQALQAFFDGLNYEQQRGNKQGMAESYNNIGVINFYQHDYDKCAEYLNKSIAISEELGDLKTVKKGYINVGAILQEAKKYDQALASYSKALKISEKLNDKLEISIAVQNMANIYVLKKEFKIAQQYYGRAVGIKKELRDYNGLAIIYVSIGAFYSGVGDQVNAEKYFMEAVQISKEKGLKDQEINAYKNLSLMHTAEKNYQKALDYQVLASDAKDSVYNIENAKNIRELQTKYETVEKEKELAQEKANVANSKLVIKQRNNTLIMVSSGFIIFLIIAIGWYNRNQYRQRQYRREVELKQRLADAELKNKIQGERERISRDLHDHIGSQLTLIISGLDTMSYTEARNQHAESAEQLNDLSDQARLTMGQLRETIWAMNKEEVSMEMLVSKIKEFTNKANRSIYTAISGDGTVVISPAKSLALFRVCQEAINNAIKHAEFTTMNIHFSADKNKIDVQISDDGKGFDQQETANGGYGLENMAFRLQECGGSFKLSSAPGQGTRIEMQVSLN